MSPEPCSDSSGGSQPHIPHKGPQATVHRTWQSASTVVPSISDNCIYRQLLCCYCCSVAKLCPTLCDPTDCGTPVFLVVYYLLELAQTHVHWWRHSTISSTPWEGCKETKKKKKNHLCKRRLQGTQTQHYAICLMDTINHWLQGVKHFPRKWKCSQSHLTLCDPMDCSPPGSSVHRILQQENWSR